MNKTLISILVAIIILVGGFFWLNNYIYQEKQGDAPVEDTNTATMYTEPTGRYQMKLANGWYPHEIDNVQVIFTPSKDFELPEGTEGFAIGDQMVVRVATMKEAGNAATPEEYLRNIGATSEQEFFIEKSEMTTQEGLPMTRVLFRAGLAQGNVLLYVYFPGDGTAVNLSHYPFNPETQSARAFETLVNSLEPVVR